MLLPQNPKVSKILNPTLEHSLVSFGVTVTSCYSIYSNTRNTNMMLSRRHSCAFILFEAFINSCYTDFICSAYQSVTLGLGE